MQIINDGRKVQVWEFVSQGLNIGKWSIGKHCDGVAVVKKRENHYLFIYLLIHLITNGQNTH